MRRSVRPGGRHRAWWLALVTSFGFLAACAADGFDAADSPSGDDSTIPIDGAEASDEGSDAVLAPTETHSETDSEGDSLDDATTDLPAERAFADRPLAEVCPARIVVQLADLPSVEHGALVRLFARLPTFDAASAEFASPVQRLDGTIDDVELVLRSGGPAIGFRPATDALDESTVLLAEATSADLVRRTGSAVAVAALTDRSHAAVMWDPATYPDVVSISDIGEAAIEVLHLTGDPLVQWLVATDVLTDDQLTPRFDGEPAAFVASGGTIAQQSDVLIDPFLYRDLPQWGRPIAVAAAANEGWTSYDDLLVVSVARRPDVDECLGTFLPLVQEAIAAQVVDPSPAVDTVLAQMRADVNPFTLLDPAVLASARSAAVESGVLTEGDTERPVGTIDLDRLDLVAAELADVLGVEPAGAPLGTNELLDPSIEN